MVTRLLLVLLRECFSSMTHTCVHNFAVLSIINSTSVVSSKGGLFCLLIKALFYDIQFSWIIYSVVNIYLGFHLLSPHSVRATPGCTAKRKYNSDYHNHNLVSVELTAAVCISWQYQFLSICLTSTCLSATNNFYSQRCSACFIITFKRKKHSPQFCTKKPLPLNLCE